jgi:hypothetical protein
MGREIAAGEKATVYCGVEGLYSSVEHLRKARDRIDEGNG